MQVPMKRFLACVAASATAVTLAGGLPARAEVGPSTRQWTLGEPDSRPDSGLRATVELTDNGSLTFAARRGDTAIIAPSSLGLTTRSADFTEGLRFLSANRRTLQETYTTPSGKRHRHHSVMRQLRLSFATASGARMDLLVRVADDGVAYRYVVPSDDKVSVTSEASAFRVPVDASAWLHDYGDHYETVWHETTVGQADAGEYGVPATFRVGTDDWLLLTESDIIDQYGGTRLTLDGATDTFHVTLPDAAETSPGTMRTPWRVAIVGDLGQVVESDFVNDLADPSRIADTSWIQPGAVAWSWWSDHGSPSSFKVQKKYVRFAAEAGWPYVLVDAGWDAEWVPDLVDYARERGVEILLWTPWTNLDTEQERQAKLTRWKSWGVVGVKIDYMDSDTQAMMHWYREVLEDTARLRLMVNFHGATVPRGIQRTWPHVMTMEAVRGAEYYTWNGQAGPVHNVILPFTRNVIGSMDYTPVTFSASPRATSDGHELGLSVVYESGWQHFADSVDSYRAHQLATTFLSEVPAAWDETHYLAGHPGELAMIARHHGNDWFVGAIAAGKSRTVTVPFDFLTGGPYLAEVVQDDGHRGLVRRTHVVTSDDTLEIRLAENGGFAIHLCRARPGVQHCGGDVQVQLHAPDRWVQSDNSVAVTANVRNTSSHVATQVAPALKLPEGMHAEGTPESILTLAPGEEARWQWTVRAGPDAVHGKHAVELKVTYRSDGGAHTAYSSASLMVPPPPPSGTAALGDVPWVSATSGWGPVERNTSNGEQAAGDGNPITLQGETYATGLGVHAPSEVVYYLGGQCSTVESDVGIDDEVGARGSVEFQIWADDTKVVDSGVLRGDSSVEHLTADVSGAKTLRLVVTGGGDGISYDHADWAGAQVTCTS